MKLRSGDPGLAPEIKPSRQVRRVLSVLLTGAGNLSIYMTGYAAAISPEAAHDVLAGLERAGWVTSERQATTESSRRKFYTLTRQGRAKAIGLLGLEMPEGGGEQ